jgi:glycosyltransferase involved in cell wall biosynthesis
VADLARAILEILDNSQLAATLARNGPAHVREHRTWEKSVAGYEALYKRVAAGA